MLTSKSSLRIPSEGSQRVLKLVSSMLLASPPPVNLMRGVPSYDVMRSFKVSVESIMIRSSHK